VQHVIHVHQQKLKKGEPAIIDRTYKGSTHHRTVIISCANCGAITARVRQPDKPDRCGARAFIETVHEVTGL